MAVLAALDALRAKGRAPTSNLKIFFEGEEEAGSPHLADILKRHAELLRADAWIIFDGPVHQSGRKQVVFGVRGVTGVDITVPLANYDNNQHAEDENIRLQNLWDGIEIVAAIMTMKP